MKNNLETEYLNKIEKLRDRLSRNNNRIKGQNLNFYHNQEGKSLKILIERDSTDKVYGRVLFNLVRKFKPKKILELGTCLGISAAYMKAAQTINGSGKLYSLEGIEKRADISKKNLDMLGFRDFKIITGQLKDTLYPILKKYGPFDFVFIDAHHQEKPIQKYFELISNHLNSNSLIIIDDIDLNENMKRAWNNMQKFPPSAYFIKFGSWGLCYFDKS